MRRVLLCCIVLVGLMVVACSPTPAAPAAATTTPATASEPTKAPTSAPAAEPTAAPALSGRISVAGSTSVQPLAEKLAAAFSAKHPGVTIDVQGGGSSVGVKSGGQGTVDIGMASREVKDSEKQEYPDLKVYAIAVDALAIIAHPGVTVDGLTSEQVQGIFAGEITNWKEIGGADRPILVVAREEGSGTRDYFQEHFMGTEKQIVDTAILQPSGGAVRTTVATTPDSIGFLSFGSLDSSVKALAIDGVEAQEANVYAGTYPAKRNLNMLTKGDPTGVAQAWLDFIFSAEGQDVVAKEHFFKVN